MSSSPAPPAASSEKPRVGLFITCLVDLFRPNVGFSAVKLLEDTGREVQVPMPQTCCGQPAYNSGDLASARSIAKQVIQRLDGYDHVVTPSGSCAGMLRVHYPKLFEGDARWYGRAQALAERTYELLSYLHDVAGPDVIETSARQSPPLHAMGTYHDSCSGLRELAIQRQPRALLAQVPGFQLTEMKDANVCCGFGGTFCVKYPKISERLVSDKVERIQSTAAQYLLGGDLGCLLNIAGRLRRLGSPVKVYHAAEVLAGLIEVAPIGGGESKPE